MLARSVVRIEKEHRAHQIARPMREAFDMLAHGEAYELAGMTVMRMPACGDDPADWCAISPAIRGYVDVMQKLCACRLHRMTVLADTERGTGGFGSTGK